MLLKGVTVLMLTALALACGGEDRPVLKVGANGTSFQRAAVPSTATTPVAIVPYTTWNRGNATAFIPACGGHPSAVVERYTGGSWESYASVFCIDVMMETPLELRAGQSRQDQVAIGDAGQFRVRVPYTGAVSADKSFNSVSAAFDVH